MSGNLYDIVSAVVATNNQVTNMNDLQENLTMHLDQIESQPDNLNKTVNRKSVKISKINRDDSSQNINENSEQDEQTAKQNIEKEEFSIWNPLTWLNHSSNSLDQIESALFECLKIKCKRDYVYIRNGAIRIWTISANTDAKSTPIVLLHDFGGGSALWIQNIGK
jgi:hypothetical protein